MSALGKRKAQAEPETGTDAGDNARSGHGSTLFVSNLPYAATSTDLQTLFSDLAPVRTAFVATAPGTGVSKGVGYVSFAAREDAASAYEHVQNEGLQMNGRSVRVDWADSKKKKDRNADPSSSTVVADASAPAVKPKKAKQPFAPRAPQDPLAIRTVVISGLPADITKPVLWKKVRKVAGAEDVEILEDATSARALFSSPAAALAAVAKLHAHVYKGAMLSAVLKKRADASTVSAASSTKPKAASRASRLIVRNLPWDVSEQDLRALFLPFGPIHSVHVPPETEGGRGRGFAFVWMLSRADAAAALAGVNGTRVRAGAAARLAEEKQKRKKDARLERKKEGEGGEEDVAAKERIVAVDWALSKDRWEEEKTRLEEEDGGDAEMDDEEASRSGSSASSDDEDSEQEDGLGVDNDEASDRDADSDEDGDDDDVRDDDDVEAPTKPQLPQTDVGTTLFVRNVPYEATEEDLRQLFRTFGPLRYARITLDPATGRGRGTAFACFWNKPDADAALAFSDTLRADAGLGAPAKKTNPFKLPSLLTPDPASSAARTLVLGGRTLDLARAVTRDEAGRLREQGERAREKSDKRNLYLLREGVITPNTPAAQSLPETEVQRRVQSFDARRALLRSNPSLYVSKTRLSVRRLPLSASEAALRKLAVHALKAFESEVGAGTREALSADELAADADAAAAADEDAEKEKGKDKPKKGGWRKERAGPVKQAKIVRQAERTDALTGRARSKGYGFVELRTHADALRVLRWANNSPAALDVLHALWKTELTALAKDGEDEARRKRAQEALESLEESGKKGTLVVEFSIENVQVVQRRKAREGEAREKGHAPKQPLQKLTDLRRTKGADADDGVDRKRRPAKKARLTDEAEGGGGEETPRKAGGGGGGALGSLIGRKRKQRKMGKA